MSPAAALLALMAGQDENFAAAMRPGGIEAQEADGQRRLASSGDRLPIRGTIDKPESRAKWEAAGFVFGEEIVDGQHRQFVACTYPAGWKLAPTEHSMWSDLLDDTGKKRASVFFKAAFYDYKAHTGGLDNV